MGFLKILFTMLLIVIMVGIICIGVWAGRHAHEEDMEVYNHEHGLDRLEHYNHGDGRYSPSLRRYERDSGREEQHADDREAIRRAYERGREDGRRDEYNHGDRRY